MVKFAKQVDPKAVANKQAANVMKAMQGSVLRSVGTVRNYEAALSKVALYANTQLHCSLRAITPQQATQYLCDQACKVGQKTLDMDRQAIQAMMHHVSKQLSEKDTLAVVKSEIRQILDARAYTQVQMHLVSNAQNERNGLATQLAHAAGLRAHELHTLRRIEERQPDVRPALNEKFSQRTGVRYTVQGKGGLVREVQIPTALAAKLEAHRLTTPRQIEDRGIRYTSHYDIGGGKAWSNSFSAASTRTLNWSSGAHGLRHSYAQERMRELQGAMTRDKALEVVSQEMGHFRPDITEVYLR